MTVSSTDEVASAQTVTRVRLRSVHRDEGTRVQDKGAHRPDVFAAPTPSSRSAWPNSAAVRVLVLLHGSRSNRVMCLIGSLPATHYRLDLQSEGGGTFWMNHCEHCGAQMEEEELHGDPGSPFGPMPVEGLEAIRLHEVREPFAAGAGGQSYDVKPMDS